MRQLILISLVVLPCLVEAAPKLQLSCQALTQPSRIELDDDFNGYFPSRSAARVKTSAKLGAPEDRARMTVTTEFKSDGSVSATEIVYSQRGVTYVAISAKLTLSRADKNATRGSHVLVAKDLVLVERRDDDATPRCFVDPDFSWSVSWDHSAKQTSPERECRRVNLPPAKSADTGEGYYRGSDGVTYLRTAQVFETASGRGAFSVVISQNPGWPQTATSGSAHLKLMLFGHEYKTYNADFSYPKLDVGFAAGEVVVRVKNARFVNEEDNDCIDAAPFDLAIRWRDVDPRTRGSED